MSLFVLAFWMCFWADWRKGCRGAVVARERSHVCSHVRARLPTAAMQPREPHELLAPLSASCLGVCIAIAKIGIVFCFHDLSDGKWVMSS